jgi:hypothetical protein
LRLNRSVAFSAALVVLCAITLAACDDQGITDAVIVKNHTKTTLHFTLVIVNGEPFALHRDLATGEEVALLTGSQLSSNAGMMRNRCTVGDLIAYAADGHEVARHAPPLCAPGVWAIEEPGSSVAAPSR